MKKQEILRKIKLFLFDMDGTLYIGDRLFDFTPRLLDTIKRNGGRYMFLTNNSSKSVNDYIKKLGGMGIKADCDDFLTSSQATAYLLRRDYPGKTLYVCGTRSLEEELEKEGFSLTCDTSRAECIVMGYDTELTYQKLYDVSYMLSTRDIPYIATNPDYVCPTEFGSVPDCGSICDMIFNATGKRPEVVGKPQPLMPLLAMERAGCKPRHGTSLKKVWLKFTGPFDLIDPGTSLAANLCQVLGVGTLTISDHDHNVNHGGQFRRFRLPSLRSITYCIK